MRLTDLIQAARGPEDWGAMLYRVACWQAVLVDKGAPEWLLAESVRLQVRVSRATGRWTDLLADLERIETRLAPEQRKAAA